MPEWQEVVSDMKNEILKSQLKRNDNPEFTNGENAGILKVIAHVERNAKNFSNKGEV